MARPSTALLAPASDPAEVQARAFADFVRSTATVRNSLTAEATNSVRGDAASAPLPPLVRAALTSPARTLDGRAKAAMENRAGLDLSGVRIHTGPVAERSVDALAAEAYTVANHIVFGPGRYAPDSATGMHLLAHEVAHVAQQTGRNAGIPVVQRQPKPAKGTAKAGKFYQYVIDEIASQESDYDQQRQAEKYEFMVRKQMNYRALKALLALAEAVEQQRTSEIPKLVDAFIAADVGPPHRALSEELLIELVVRLTMLGLDAESTKLRENYSKGEQQYDWIKRDTGLIWRNIEIHRRLVDRAAETADHSTAETTKATIDRYLKLLIPLRDEMLGMSEFDREHTYYKKQWEGLLEVFERLVAVIAASLQSLAERAANQLGSGDPDGKATLLLIRELVEKRIVPALDVEKNKMSLGNLRIVVAATELKQGKGVIRDPFDRNRTVAVSAYTPGKDDVRQLESTVLDVFTRRGSQVAELARIYGAVDVLRKDRPAEKSRIADAAANAATLKKVLAAGGQLRLESDDDWRDFVLQKYNDLTGPGGKSQEEALDSVMSLLFDYLQAFTIHARFTDIYDRADFKDAYFNKPFPRTLSGRIVQDCGVYAMRVAYILSRVRTEMKLRFRFIRLPAHIGLIITGDGLPVYIAHNNRYQKISLSRLQELKDSLAVLAEGGDAAAGGKAGTGTAATTAPPITDDELLAEIAAADFFSGYLETPYSLSEVPKPEPSAIATQKALWAEYQRVGTKDVFGPASSQKQSSSYLFHNRYLKILEEYREWHNRRIVPFWNLEAPKAWTVLEKAVKAGARTHLTGAELAPLLDKHLQSLRKAEEPVNERLKYIRSVEAGVSKELRADPKLKAPGTQRTQEGRIEMVPQWRVSLEDYVIRVQLLLTDAKDNPTKKFDVGAVLKQLAPPFIPVAEKGQPILD